MVQLHTNELVVNEFKPLYAFVLALIADVMTLENNIANLKQAVSIPFTNLTFKSFDIPLPLLKNKHIGFKNIVFAGAIAAGVAVGQNVGYFAIPYSKALDENNHSNRKKITLAMDVICSTTFAFLARWVLFQRSSYSRVLNYIATNSRRTSNQVTRRENYLKGVNTETVLSNVVKTMLTAGTVNLSADGIANLLSF